MDAVELHAQAGDAGALALARLELDQEGVATAADGAKLVECRVVAGGDDAAVAQLRCRLVGECRCEQRGDGGRRCQALGQHVDQHAARRRQLRDDGWQRLQRRTQAGELARPRLAQGDAGADALDVGEMAKRLAQRYEVAAVQRVDGVVAIAGDAAIAQRPRQPLPERATAHAGAAAVEQREQRRRVVAAQRSRQLEVAVGGRRQVDQVAALLNDEPVQMGEGAALGVLGVGEQGPGGSLGEVELGGAEGGERGDPKLRAELALAETGVELPRRALRQRRRHRVDDSGWQLVAGDDLGRRQPRQPARQLAGAALGEADLALRQRRPRQPEALAATRHCEQHGVALLGEQVALGQRPRRDDANHLALDRPLARTDFADLLADRDRLAELHEPGQVGVDRVVRHAGHRDRLAGTGAARRQGDVEEAVRLLRVVVEELVEIAHPVEDERVGMIGLDAQPLLHHRRVCRQIGHGRSPQPGRRGSFFPSLGMAYWAVLSCMASRV